MPPNTSTGASLPKSPPAGLTAGVDWAKDDHVVAVVDSTGQVTDRFTIDHTEAGLAELIKRLARSAWLKLRSSGRTGRSWTHCSAPR
ncbi:MAG: IS110 family transposase [Geodermatophilaceae bacterium]